jgi:hypothetical protein
MEQAFSDEAGFPSFLWRKQCILPGSWVISSHETGCLAYQQAGISFYHWAAHFPFSLAPPSPPPQQTIHQPESVASQGGPGGGGHWPYLAVISGLRWYCGSPAASSLGAYSGGTEGYRRSPTPPPLFSRRVRTQHPFFWQHTQGEKMSAPSPPNWTSVIPPPPICGLLTFELSFGQKVGKGYIYLEIYWFTYRVYTWQNMLHTYAAKELFSLHIL